MCAYCVYFERKRHKHNRTTTGNQLSPHVIYQRTPPPFQPPHYHPNPPHPHPDVHKSNSFLRILIVRLFRLAAFFPLSLYPRSRYKPFYCRRQYICCLSLSASHVLDLASARTYARSLVVCRCCCIELSFLRFLYEYICLSMHIYIDAASMHE